MVYFSGFYSWLKEPLSQRAQEDARQTDLIQQAWTDSGKVYGYPLPDRVMRSMIPKRANCTMIFWIRVRPAQRTVLLDWPA